MNGNIFSLLERERNVNISFLGKLKCKDEGVSEHRQNNLNKQKRPLILVKYALEMAPKGSENVNEFPRVNLPKDKEFHAVFVETSFWIQV